MKHACLLLAIIGLVCNPYPALAQDMDKALSELAERLAVPVKENAKKKVAVLDFTDLEGATTELGKYIAEQVTVDLVIAKRDFQVLDRANLKSILSEHKLTATGLIDPANAKKLGEFAGVDALILGTITPKGGNLSLTAKIVTTDTAVVIGAARTEFKKDETVQQLSSRTITEAKKESGAIGIDAEQAKAAKTFGDVRVELQSLRIVNGDTYLVTFTLANQNKRRSAWVSVFCTGLKFALTDAEGFEFSPDLRSVSGLHFPTYYESGSIPTTEIRPNDSLVGTVRFFSPNNRKATAGSCRLQVEVFVGNDARGREGTRNNFFATLEVE